MLNKNIYLPVAGKRVLVANWSKSAYAFSTAKAYPGCTGVAIRNDHTCVLDKDKCLTDPAWLQIFEELSASDHYRIQSPRPDSDKFLFLLPPELTGILRYAVADGGALELRTGKGTIDVLPGSLYKDKGYSGVYTGMGRIQPLPEDIAGLWLHEQEKVTLSAVKGKVNPTTTAGKLSAVYYYNATQSIRELLEGSALFDRFGGSRYTYVGGSTKGGVVVYPANGEGREGTEIATLHHASLVLQFDGLKCIDAFELGSWLEYPGLGLAERNRKFAAKLYHSLTVEIETGEILSLHRWNDRFAVSYPTLGETS